MCVTVYQIVGYSVPSKKVELMKKNVSNHKEIFKGFDLWSFPGNRDIYAVSRSESTCECGDEDGDGREFERDTFEPLVYDEDDMELTQNIKDNLFAKLKQVGLDRCAIFGVFTDTNIECH